MTVIFTQSSSLLVHMGYKNAFAGTVPALHAIMKVLATFLVLSITTVNSLLTRNVGQCPT